MQLSITRSREGRGWGEKKDEEENYNNNSNNKPMEPSSQRRQKLGDGQCRNTDSNLHFFIPGSIALQPLSPAERATYLGVAPSALTAAWTGCDSSWMGSHSALPTPAPLQGGENRRAGWGWWESFKIGVWHSVALTIINWPRVVHGGIAAATS